MAIALNCQPGEARRDRGQRDQGGDRNQVRGRKDDGHALPQALRGLGAGSAGRRLSRSPLAPEEHDDHGATDQGDGHREENALGAEAFGLRELLGEKPRKDPAADAARADEAEDPLGLARRQQVVGERPHLGRCDDADNADPDVEHGVLPGQLRSELRQIPEAALQNREEEQAAHEEIAEHDPPADRHVGRDRHAHRQGDRHVGVRKLRGLEDAQKERVARGLAELVARDDQEEVEEEQRAAPAVSGLEVEEPGERVRPHRAASVAWPCAPGRAKEAALRAGSQITRRGSPA